MQNYGTVHILSLIHISQRMLTVTLRTLETDGLVSRKVYAEVPPRVEYELTERGKSLIPHIEGLVDWALQPVSYTHLDVYKRQV